MFSSAPGRSRTCKARRRVGLQPLELADARPRDRESRRKPWDSNPQAAFGRHLFSRQAPGHLPKGGRGRMTSVANVVKKLRGLESNQRPPGSEPGVTTSSNYPGSFIFRTPRSARSSGRRGRTSVSWVKARRPTASRSPITSSTRSALRESNPPSQLGRLGPLPIGQGHVRRKERESNPQGSSLVPTTAARRCPRAGCRRQSACPSTLSCGGRNRTCAGAVNSRLPVPARVPPQSTSWARCNRTELSKSQEHRAGVEPALPHYGCGVVAAGPPVLVVFSGTGRT